MLNRNPRTPSLTALRVFVAVARQGGVSRAALALHLTHSAVSHQIRALQDELGITLLEKNGRGLRLTAAASAYAARIENAFAEIDSATEALQAFTRPRLRISTIPSFAARWLLPRLGQFISACPDFDVDVQSTAQLADLKGGEVDVALRFGLGRYPGLASECVMRDWLFPVCSPDFAARYPLGKLTRIDEVPLLNTDNEPWSAWLAAAGFAVEEPRQGLVFSDSGLAIQAALAGQGLCLGRQSIVYEDLAAGRLVRPFTAFVESPNAYYFVCRKDKLASPAVLSFRRWLGEQLEAYPVLG